MKLRILTWNSNNINSGSPFTAYIPPLQMANISKNPVLVNRAGDYPFLSTVVKNSNPLVVGVQIAPGNDINTNRELLKQYFFGDDSKHNLIAQDEANGNLQYYRTGIPITLSQENANTPNSFYVTIQTEYNYWRLVTPTSDSWDITASGDSDAVTNAGNIRVPPIFTFTPQTTKTAGYQYRRYVTAYNNMDRSFVSPLEVTGGGLDVQSLIDANKMQADGDDFRIWQDGAFADRWLSGMDSDSDPALCWVNSTYSPRHEAVTSATFDSDDTTMSFAQTRASKSFLQWLRTAPNSTLLIESEAVTFDPANVNVIEYQVTSIQRGQKDTTAVSHSSGVTVRHLEHDLWILYGDSDATAPDVDDAYKPILNLTSSNAAWSYTNFFDATNARPGAWKGEVLASKTGLSYTFTDSDPTQNADPSTELGLAIVGSPSAYSSLYETATLDWLFSDPRGITNVVYSPMLYRTNSWPAVVGLQYLQPNTAWFTAQNETAPTSSNVWSAGGDSDGIENVSLGGTYETIRFAIDGTLNNIPNEQAMAQFHTVTVSFDSDNLPSVSVGAETAVNFFDFKLTNSTTGEYIKVQVPCPVGMSLTVDCEAKRAYLSDGTRVAVTFSSSREAWLDLLPGVNNLVYTDVGTVAVNVVISHRDRVL